MKQRHSKVYWTSQLYMLGPMTWNDLKTGSQGPRLETRLFYCSDVARELLRSSLTLFVEKDAFQLLHSAPDFIYTEPFAWPGFGRSRGLPASLRSRSDFIRSEVLRTFAEHTRGNRNSNNAPPQQQKKIPVKCLWNNELHTAITAFQSRQRTKKTFLLKNQTHRVSVSQFIG